MNANKSNGALKRLATTLLLGMLSLAGLASTGCKKGQMYDLFELFGAPAGVPAPDWSDGTMDSEIGFADMIQKHGTARIFWRR